AQGRSPGQMPCTSYGTPQAPAAFRPLPKHGFVSPASFPQVPFAIVGFDSLRSDLHAGVVAEHVDRAVRLLDARHHGFPPGAAGDIGVVARADSSLRLQLRGSGGSEVVDYGGRSVDRSSARPGTNVCGTHSVCPAGYDRHFAADMTGVAHGHS